jgi:hypothetical protein
MPDADSHPVTKRFLLPTAVISAAVLAVACWTAFMQRRIENVKDLFGGFEGLVAVVEPEQVEAYRVARLHKILKGENPETIGGAGILSGPVAVDEATARDLAEILKSADTYGWDFAKGCKFDPGVAIRFIGKSSTTDVLFCFHCEELQVWRDGKRVGGEDFDADSHRLRAIMKRIFPDDEEIQGL